MKLSQAELRLMRLSLTLAVRWESELVMANTPDGGELDAYQQKTIRGCERNIKRMHALRDRVDAEIRG
jgi:hypothetical protein